MKKWVLILAASAVVLSGVLGVALAAGGFPDLPEGHWARGAVERMAALGIVGGFPDGAYKGDKAVTRYEVATMLDRLTNRIGGIPASATGGKWVSNWPFDPALPDHLWLDLGGGEAMFLHFSQPLTDVSDPFDPEFLNEKLIYVGLASRGRFFKEEQPAGSAYTHFHRLTAESAEAGHGGGPGAEGYWLTHVAVRNLEMMWGSVAPGVDFGFMPTPAAGEAQTAKVASADDWKWTGDWPFSPPLPDHRFIDLGGGRAIFLHYDRPAGQEGARLVYAGDMVRGRFCAEEQPPDPAYTHFHRFNADSAEAGHGGQAGAEGYWLRHAAVTTMAMPWGTITPGVDFKFMPTPAPACGR